MEELINLIKAKTFKYVLIRNINPRTNEYLDKGIKRVLLKSDDSGFVSISFLVEGGLKVARKFPTEGNYKMVENGYQEKIFHATHGTKFVEVKFLKA